MNSYNNSLNTYCLAESLSIPIYQSASIDVQCIKPIIKQLSKQTWMQSKALNFTKQNPFFLRITKKKTSVDFYRNINLPAFYYIFT